MRCPNCKGKGKFKNLRCWQCRPNETDKADPNCKHCFGKGTYDYNCDHCNGRGKVSDIYHFCFSNEEMAEEEHLVIDVGRSKIKCWVADNSGNKIFPIAADFEAIIEKRERPNDYFPGKIMRDWEIPMEEIFGKICRSLDVSRGTHFMYIEKQLTEFGHIFHDIHAIGNKSGWDPDPSRATIVRSAKEAVARHFSWYFRKTANKELRIGFARRKPTEVLLEDLWQKVSARSYGYDLAVWEGNIATGERGWAVILVGQDQKPKAFITVAYDLEISLQEAIERIDEVIKKIEAKKDK